MAEKDDNLSLPKATISKLIKEMLPDDVKCANDTRDLILECCVEFIHLISSEANEIANNETKKTIGAEHVLKALKSLGFNEFTEDVTEVYEKHKTDTQENPKGRGRLENRGIPAEQLLREQQQLFERARTALHNSQQGLVRPDDPSPTTPLSTPLTTPLTTPLATPTTPIAPPFLGSFPPSIPPS